MIAPAPTNVSARGPKNSQMSGAIHSFTTSAPTYPAATEIVRSYLAPTSITTRAGKKTVRTLTCAPIVTLA